MEKPNNIIFTEKYRPKKINEIVGSFKDKITKYLEEPSSIPNFLFYSKTPGTGKSSLAKCIINELGCDYIVINSSDERGIESVREKVKEFAMTKSTRPDLRRCVFLDEFDGMLMASQNALRNVMEEYAKNAFFILTCNNINKVIEPLKSRCIVIPFSSPDKKDIYKYLEMICEKEDMDYTEDGIQCLIDKNYPSIRNCVLALQDLKVEGLQIIRDNVKSINVAYDKLWEALKEKRWRDIKKEVLETSIDARDLNNYFWKKALEEDNRKVLQLTCVNEKDISIGADANVIFVTSLIEMVK